MRVLGIDPGLNACGWGVIDVDGPRLSHVASGTVRPAGADLGARLAALHDGLDAALRAHAPDAAAVEQTFATANGASTLKLGQARGVAMLVPARAGLPVGEYAPNAVKKAVVGAGHAGKDQIGYMVRLQLPGADPGSADAADALAVAICHAIHLRASARISA
ncbi:MAG: crossover junction endodeoxyribonuclease RuvC [Hasllibacter sp.]